LSVPTCDCVSSQAYWYYGKQVLRRALRERTVRAKELSMAQVPESDRLAQVEQVIALLQEQITHQQEEIARLKAAAPTTVGPAAAEPDEPLHDGQRRAHTPRGGTSSRRALLKLGGAAAAAGVAAVAAGATELGHPSTAHAHSDGITFYQSASGGGSGAIEGEGFNGAFGLWGNGWNGAAGVGAIADANHAMYAESRGVGASVYGLSKATGHGVVGDSTNGSGFGVFGVSSGNSSSNAVGVYGQSNGQAAGVQGTSAGGIGVWGGTNNGFPAVGGDGGWWVGGFFRGAAAQIELVPHGGAGAPTGGNQFAGMLYMDGNGTLWLCIGDGSPGTWVRLTGVQSGLHGGAISYLSTPVRLLDARGGANSGIVNRGALGGNEVYPFTVAGLGGSGIPANAQGLIANITVLGPSGTGNLSLFPAPGPGPSVASMTFGQPGVALANGVNVAIGTSGQIMIQNQSSGFTPLVLDAVAFVR
jgi:hypothetical protein